MRTLCLGEALVDLVAEPPAPTLAGAARFVPEVGGAAARTCVVAARHGARVALAAAAAEDAWGRWLRGRLAAAGVDLGPLQVLEDGPTPVAFVAAGAGGDEEVVRYGAPSAVPAGAVVPGVVEGCDALLVSAAALARPGAREATLEAREHALRLGRPVVVDADLGGGGWPSPGAAATAARELLDGAFLVRCDRADAAAISGEQDPVRAAAGILAGSARNVVVTLGGDGALLRGEGGLRADARGASGAAPASRGARDAATGVLLAALGTTGFYPPAVAAALPAAVAEAARPGGAHA